MCSQLGEAWCESLKRILLFHSQLDLLFPSCVATAFGFGRALRRMPLLTQLCMVSGLGTGTGKSPLLLLSYAVAWMFLPKDAHGVPCETNPGFPCARPTCTQLSHPSLALMVRKGFSFPAELENIQTEAAVIEQIWGECAESAVSLERFAWDGWKTSRTVSIKNLESHQHILRVFFPLSSFIRTT